MKYLYSSMFIIVATYLKNLYPSWTIYIFFIRELQILYSAVRVLANSILGMTWQGLGWKLGSHRWVNMKPPLIYFSFHFSLLQLHQLMPSVVTCLVAKRLGSRLADNHWELRDFTANLVASICKRWDILSLFFYMLYIKGNVSNFHLIAIYFVAILSTFPSMILY